MGAPRDDLVRAVYPGVTLRAAEAADDTGLGRLTGHFSTFDDWYEVDSAYEGHFLERIAPGAFTDTIAADKASMRVLLNHGADPQVGDKPLGPIDVLREDETGGYYEVPLLDTSYNRDIAPGLRAGVYGSSFRFSVRAEEWQDAPARATHNPEALPERTITSARVFEFGPVTFPANPSASAGVRSLTDRFRGVPAEPTTPEPAQPVTRKETPKMTETTEYITRDEKAARLRDLKESIIAVGTEHPGVLPPEVQTRWDSENAEVEILERDIAAWDERQARLRRFASEERNVEPAVPAVISRPSEADIYDTRAIVQNSRTPAERSQKFRDNAMRAAEQMRVPVGRYDQDKSRERLISLLEYTDDPEERHLAQLVLNTNSPAYRSAFNRYIASGGHERGTALAVGVDATGGFSVPVAYDPTIVAIGAWTAINPYRAACRVETISGTDTWQALTATAITATYALEAAAATEQGPTFARPEYIAKRAHSFVTVSYEMAQDRPSLPADLGRLFGEAKDNLEEAQFTIGVGTTVYPQGIGLKDAFTRADSAGAAVAVADILAIDAALPIRHRMNAAWFLSRAAIRAIQAFETAGGQLFNSTIGYPAVGNPAMVSSGNTGLTLLGHPIWETPSMPWTPSTTDTTWGVLMDPTNYVIVDRVGMSVKVIPDMLNGATPSFPTGEIGIYAFWRNTARVLNVDGGRQGGVQ